MLPFWESDIIPPLQDGLTVGFTTYGNSLCALVKHLDGISDDAIVELNIPPASPCLRVG